VSYGGPVLVGGRLPSLSVDEALSPAFFSSRGLDPIVVVGGRSFHFTDALTKWDGYSYAILTANCKLEVCFLTFTSGWRTGGDVDGSYVVQLNGSTYCSSVVTPLNQELSSAGWHCETWTGGGTPAVSIHACKRGRRRSIVRFFVARQAITAPVRDFLLLSRGGTTCRNRLGARRNRHGARRTGRSCWLRRLQGGIVCLLHTPSSLSHVPLRDVTLLRGSIFRKPEEALRVSSPRDRRLLHCR
jgi:hypothetical protein